MNINPEIIDHVLLKNQVVSFDLPPLAGGKSIIQLKPHEPDCLYAVSSKLIGIDSNDNEPNETTSINDCDADSEERESFADLYKLRRYMGHVKLTHFHSSTRLAKMKYLAQSEMDILERKMFDSKYVFKLPHNLVYELIDMKEINPDYISQMCNAGVRLFFYDLRGDLLPDQGQRIVDIKTAFYLYNKQRDIQYVSQLILGISECDIRLGYIPDGQVILKNNDEIIITADRRLWRRGRRKIFYANILNYMSELTEGSAIRICDAILEVVNVIKISLICKVVTGGQIFSDELITFPSSRISLLAEEGDNGIDESEEESVMEPVECIEQTENSLECSQEDESGAQGFENNESILDIDYLMENDKEQSLTEINYDEYLSKEQLEDIEVVKRYNICMIVMPRPGTLENLIALRHKLPQHVKILTFISKDDYFDMELFESYCGIIFRPGFYCELIIKRMYELKKIVILNSDAINHEPEDKPFLLYYPDSLFLSSQIQLYYYMIWSQNLIPIDYLMEYVPAITYCGNSRTMAKIVAITAISMKVKAIINTTISGRSAITLSNERPCCPIISMTRNKVSAKLMTPYAWIRVCLYPEPISLNRTEERERYLRYGIRYGKSLNLFKDGDLIIFWYQSHRTVNFCNNFRVVTVRTEVETIDDKRKKRSRKNITKSKKSQTNLKKKGSKICCKNILLPKIDCRSRRTNV